MFSPSVYSSPIRFNPKTLRRGATGSDVRLLQEHLRDALYRKGEISVLSMFGSEYTKANFGTTTEFWVKKFQEKMGLEVDGIVGPKTWGALLGSSSSSSTSASFQPSSDGSTLPVPTHYTRSVPGSGSESDSDSFWGENKWAIIIPAATLGLVLLVGLPLALSRR